MKRATLTLVLILLGGCVSPESPARLSNTHLDSSGVYHLDLGSSATLIEGELLVESLSDLDSWIYAAKTNAPSAHDPEQEQVESYSASPLELPEHGFLLPAGITGRFPVAYDCQQTDTLGAWAAGIKVYVGEREGGFENAVWMLGTVDLKGECTEEVR